MRFLCMVVAACVDWVVNYVYYGTMGGVLAVWVCLNHIVYCYSPDELTILQQVLVLPTALPLWYIDIRLQTRS